MACRDKHHTFVIDCCDSSPAIAVANHRPRLHRLPFLGSG
nr:MAG TPA: Caspase 3 [Caudoviricetes sp.]